MRELRIGASPTLPAEAVDSSLIATENPNFVDAMTHWAYSEAFGPVAATMGLPMEFTPDPTITTSCKYNNDSGYNPSGGWANLSHDLIAIPDEARALLPCDFTASYWRLQVSGVELPYANFIPTIWWYDESQSPIWYASGETQTTDLHAWQRESVTALVPATAYYLRLSTGYNGGIGASMYYTACRLERDGVSVVAPIDPSFSVSRDSAGILLAVRDNAAPQFAVGRDTDGLSIKVPR